jgi:hypothetical protein
VGGDSGIVAEDPRLLARERIERALQNTSPADALLEFSGCMLVTSHDRWPPDHITTHIFVANGDSQWTFFAGNYAEYE